LPPADHSSTRESRYAVAVATVTPIIPKARAHQPGSRVGGVLGPMNAAPVTAEMTCASAEIVVFTRTNKQMKVPCQGL